MIFRDYGVEPGRLHGGCMSRARHGRGDPEPPGDLVFPGERSAIMCSGTFRRGALEAARAVGIPDHDARPIRPSLRDRLEFVAGAMDAGRTAGLDDVHKLRIDDQVAPLRAVPNSA
jgi:hypothetical protein